LFESFLSLGRGCEIVVPRADLPFFAALREELENGELVFNLMGNLDIAGWISRLRCMARLHQSADRERECLASHFAEMPESALESLSVDDLEAILSHPSLRLVSEDWLFDLAMARFSQSPESFGLVEHIRFEYLSVDRIQCLVEGSRDFFAYGSVSLWELICRRLCPAAGPRELKSRYDRRPSIVNRSGSANALHGIIWSLTSTRGGKIPSCEVVQATSRTAGRRGGAQNAANLRGDSLFASADRPGQWLCYRFLTGTLRLTGYSIRSQYCNGPGNCYPKDWVVETSVDRSHWTVVDQQTDNHDLNARNVTKWFPLREDCDEECRFVRLRQTGRNHGGSDALALSGFEVFGDFFES
jgi:hypothetical protein